MDEIDDEAEFRAYLAYLDKCIESLFWAYVNMPSTSLVDAWYDIHTYGLEPVFTDLLFDRVIEEHNEHLG